jgi:hypothetical protein
MSIIDFELQVKRFRLIYTIVFTLSVGKTESRYNYYRSNSGDRAYEIRTPSAKITLKFNIKLTQVLFTLTAYILYITKLQPLIFVLKYIFSFVYTHAYE